MPNPTDATPVEPAAIRGLGGGPSETGMRLGLTLRTNRFASAIGRE